MTFPEGQGVRTFESEAFGYKYSGTFAAGKQAGRGEEQKRNGKVIEIYKGEFQDGKRNGKGTLTRKVPGLKDFKFVGDFKGGVPHGQGNMVNHDQSTYSGPFQNSLPHGSGGQKTLSNGDTYKGDWVRGMMHGQGVLVTSSGDRYEGKFNQNRRTGKGTMTFGKTSPFNGDKYEGDFVNGKPHGQGTYTKANGIVYTGQLKDGVPNGQGTATTPCWRAKDRHLGEW